MIHGHHLSGYRKPDEPIRLNATQRARKWLFCIVMCSVFAVLAFWGGLWAVAAASDGVVSVTHLLALIVGALMAVTFGDIAEHEAGRR